MALAVTWSGADLKNLPKRLANDLQRILAAVGHAIGNVSLAKNPRWRKAPSLGTGWV